MAFPIDYLHYTVLQIGISTNPALQQRISKIADVLSRQGFNDYTTSQTATVKFSQFNAQQQISQVHQFANESKTECLSLGTSVLSFVLSRDAANSEFAAAIATFKSLAESLKDELDCLKANSRSTRFVFGVPVIDLPTSMIAAEFQGTGWGDSAHVHSSFEFWDDVETEFPGRRTLRVKATKKHSTEADDLNSIKQMVKPIPIDRDANFGLSVDIFEKSNHFLTGSKIDGNLFDCFNRQYESIKEKLATVFTGAK
jgi:hypothetical protein